MRNRKMIIYRRFYILLFLSFLLASCSSIPKDHSGDVYIGRQMWTATNLRIFKKNRISWRNLLTGSILPLGRTMRFKEINVEYAIFIDNQDREYRIYWKGIGENFQRSFKEEVHKYFTTKDPTEEFQKLSQEKQEDIFIGEIRRGMTKKEVYWSLGHPYNSKNPMEEKIWIYWADESTKLAIYFKKNRVVQIVR